MKLQCNVCKESPVVKIHKPKYEGEEIYCPSCGKILAIARPLHDLSNNIIFKAIDTNIDKRIGFAPVTILHL